MTVRSIAILEITSFDDHRSDAIGDLNVSLGAGKRLLRRVIVDKPMFAAGSAVEDDDTPAIRISTGRIVGITHRHTKAAPLIHTIHLDRHDVWKALASASGTVDGRIVQSPASCRGEYGDQQAVVVPTNLSSRPRRGLTNTTSFSSFPRGGDCSEAGTG